ncbi:MAG TPA: twin-arginine translocation signal domain-containing protein, partial [Pyrinomonadaceae bacterium]|nr:twin-arginine translocation signal domain-containing protein [Pyrinomonadaceae bacterium]
MGTTRRDFLRSSACALGSMALASSIDTFGIVHALTPQAASDYKALVCVFLNGGNDGNNMLVSLDQYNAYSNARSAAGLAIAQASLLPISPVSGGSYGFHPSMPEMQSLFNQGKLAVLCNNGPLVEPLTRTTYQNGTGQKPLQLFSHSDQVGLFQTAIANTVSQTGWGGRLADKIQGLNGAATFPSNVSIAGINLFLSGVDTRQLAVADSNTSLANVLQLNMSGTTGEQASRLISFNELRTLDNGFKLVKAASDIRSSSIETDNALSSVNPTLATAFPNTSLGRQLKQVALL